MSRVKQARRMAPPGRRGQEFRIESVVMGDGSKGACGRILEEGVYYASSSVSGGRESFYAIEINSVNLSTRGGRGIRFNTRCLSGENSETAEKMTGPRPKITKSMSHYKRKKVIRNCVGAFCAANPGVVVSVAGPGARGKNTKAAQYLEKDMGTSFATNKDGLCLEVSILNAIYCAKGRDEAMRAKDYIMASERHFTSLKSSASMIRQLDAKCTYLKKSLSDIPGDPFEWLADKTEGYWIVRLFQKNVVDHCVLIDAFKKLIYDGEEPYPLRLAADSLRSCGGDDAKKLLVGEVRQLYFY